jgi:hypothetical protein
MTGIIAKPTTSLYARRRKATGLEASEMASTTEQDQMTTVIIGKGRQGDWFLPVTINGVEHRLPTAHMGRTYTHDGRLHYHEPHWAEPRASNGRSTAKQCRETMDALREHQMVVLTRDETTFDRNGAILKNTRKATVGVHRVENMNDTDGLRYTIGDRV